MDKPNFIFYLSVDTCIISTFCLSFTLWYYICMSISYRASQVLVVENSPANAGDIRDTGLNPWSGRSPREENVNPLQYSCLEHPMGRGAWRATIHGVTRSQTRLEKQHVCMHHVLSIRGSKVASFLSVTSFSQSKNKHLLTTVCTWGIVLSSLYVCLIWFSK